MKLWIVWYITLVVVVLWALALIFALSPAVSHGTTLPIRFIAPSLNSDSTVCTDLDHFQVYGVRCFDVTDTLAFPGTIPGWGLEGQTVDTDLEVAPGTVGWIWVTAFDISGNESKPSNSLMFAIPYTDPPIPGLRATYYIGTDLTVEASVQVDTAIAYSWGDGALWPGGSIDNASVRWGGKVDVPAAGAWTFFVASDDGCRLWIDGAVVMDDWRPRWDETAWTGTLSKGRHAIALEYEEIGGGALCQLRWSGPGVGKELVPASALSH